MKVFYKNKVGILTESSLCRCPSCVFYPKNDGISKCWDIGIIHLCCKVKYHKFVTDLNTSIFQL